jgi:hypothetical protein
MSSNHARVETPATTSVATSLPGIDDLLETGEPVYVLYRTARAWPKQHRIEATEDGLETACIASKSSPSGNYELTEFDPDGRKCQHQNCFGPGPLPVDEIHTEGMPAKFESPLLRPANGGRVHKLEDGSTLPACKSRLHKTNWVVVEEDELEEEAEKCGHQDCFGNPAELRQPERPRLCSRSSNRVHKPAGDGAQPACTPQSQSSEWFVVDEGEVDEEAEKCQHQYCFGDPPELQQMDRPRLRSSRDGPVHKPGDSSTATACNTSPNKNDWFVVEADEVEEAEKCQHLGCFGDWK